MASKHVSIDEYLASKGYGGVSRKHFARDSGVIIKAARLPDEKCAKFDKDAGTMRFVMSAEVEDRDRDIVIQAGLDTTEFEKNPVAPWAHRAGDPPVGKWTDLSKSLSGRPKRTEGTLNLTMADPVAQRLAAHFEAGSLAACSIGFMPKEIERREVPEEERDEYYYYPGYIIHSAELYECSPCTIPANPAALAKAAAGGDVLARETIEQVLDCWDMRDGVLVPRKAFEDAHRQASGDRVTVTVKGKNYEVVDGPNGEPALKLDPPMNEAEIREAGIVDVVKRFFGLSPKSRTDSADPKPEQDGPKPAPEPTDQQKLIDELAKDLPALQTRHKLLDANAREAALDAEMGLHVPA